MGSAIQHTLQVLNADLQFPGELSHHLLWGHPLAAQERQHIPFVPVVLHRQLVEIAASGTTGAEPRHVLDQVVQGHAGECTLAPRIHSRGAYA